MKVMVVDLGIRGMKKRIFPASIWGAQRHKNNIKLLATNLMIWPIRRVELKCHLIIWNTDAFLIQYHTLSSTQCGKTDKGILQLLITYAFKLVWNSLCAQAIPQQWTFTITSYIPQMINKAFLIRFYSTFFEISCSKANMSQNILGFCNLIFNIQGS